MKSLPKPFPSDIIIKTKGTHDRFVEGFIELHGVLVYGQIVSRPIQKWYQQLFQFITFNWYKAPWHYTLRISEC